MDDVHGKARGVSEIGRYRHLLVWLAVALLLIVAGCSGAPAAAGDPDDARPIMAHDPYPTQYAESEPGSDEVVLKWNGTLVLKGEDKPYR